MFFLILLVLLLVPPLVTFWITTSLSPSKRLRTGLAIGLAGGLVIIFPFLRGGVENAARRLPMPVIGTTEIGRRAWVNGPHEINLVVALPEDAKPSSGLADVEWEVRRGDLIVARGNPSRDGERVDPALQRQADQMAERGKELRAKAGLPPLPERPFPKSRHFPIGGFEAEIGRLYTVKITSHLDPQMYPRAYVAAASNPKDRLSNDLSVFVLGLGLILGGAASSFDGRLSRKKLS